MFSDSVLILSKNDIYDIENDKMYLYRESKVSIILTFKVKLQHVLHATNFFYQKSIVIYYRMLIQF